MNVFLTGATGFVGGALARALITRGDKVTAIARPSSNRETLAGLPIRWVTGDITEPETLPLAMADCDTVIHAAGRLGAFGISQEEYDRLHVEGSLNVIHAALNADIQRILYISSPGVLGPTENKPKDESAPYGPTNPYERSKAAAEEAVRQLIHEKQAPVVIVRPEFMYGPNDLHVLGLFRAVQSGRFFLINRGRSYCHPTYIDDGVDGMLLALDQGKVGEIYHITGERSLPMRDFAMAIARATGGRPPRISLPRPLTQLMATIFEWIGRRAGITPPLTHSAVDFFSTSYRFHWQKARDELGYWPQVNLEAGLRQTVEWYRQNGHL